MNYLKNRFKKSISISLIASFAVVASFLLLPLTQAQAASEVTFQPSGGLNNGTDEGSASGGKDTYISSTRYGDFDTDLGSSVNFGARAELIFDYYASYDGYPLLKFDVSTLPSDITSAKLYLYSTANCGGGSCPNMDWTVNAITSPWNEMSATWNTRPTLGGSYGTLNIPASPTGIANARWVSVDITDLYNGWKNGTITNYGIGFTRLGSTWDGGVWLNKIASSDYETASLRPKLIIESVGSRSALNSGDVFVVDPSAPGEAGVFKFDSSTWQATLISSNGYFSEPMGIALSNDGNILIGDPQYPNGSGSGAIFKVNPADGVQTILSSGNLFTDPRGIAVAANGDIFVADPDAFNYYGGVIKVDPNTGAQAKIYQSADINAGPVYLAFEANGNLVVSDVSGTSKGVVRVNPTTGVGVQLAAGGNFVYPLGIAVAVNGDIFVADNGGKIIKVNPVSGAQTVIASSYPLACPVGIAFDNSGDLLVSDPCNEPGAIIKINPTTGAANVVANNFGSVSPNGLVVVPVAVTPPPQPTVSGDVVVGSCSGWCGSYGNDLLSKLDSAGNTLWTKSIGAIAISINPVDHSIIIGDQYGHVKKLDLNGNVLWDKNLNAYYAWAVSVNYSNGSIVVGTYGVDNLGHVIQLDSDGNTLWDKNVNLTSILSVSVNPSNGSIVVGGRESNNTGHVIKLDSSGNTLWDKNVNLYQVYKATVSVNYSDNSIAVGTSNGLIKLDSNGNTLWTKTTGYGSETVSVNPSDGSIAIGTWTGGTVIKLDSNGNILWVRSIGANALVVSVSSIDGSIAVGTQWYNRVVKLDSSGNTLWDKNMGTNTWSVAVESYFAVPPDLIPPVIAAHADVTAEAIDAAGVVVTYTSPTTFDAVDGAGVAACLPASGSTFPIGDTVVMCVASDAAGNTANASFTVTVSYNPPPADSDGDGIPDSIDACDNSHAPTGMTGCWGFNETSGTTAADSSGNNNTGTLVNNPSWIAGKVNNGLSFSNGQYVQIPHSSNLNIAGNLTIDMWINPNSVTCAGADPGYVLISKRTTNTGQPYTFYIGCGGSLRLNYWSTAGPSPFPTFGSTGTVSTGAWQHVAVTRSLSGNDATVTFYINGVAAGSSVQTTGVAYTNSHPVWISKDGYFTGYTNQGSYSGLIDEVAIYNRVLSAAEIQQHYQNGLQGKGYCEVAVPPADTQPPTITVPSDIVIEATSPAGAAVNYTADATDNVEVTSFSCSPASGSTFPIGNTVVTCVASDAAGNIASASFNVRVDNNNFYCGKTINSSAVLNSDLACDGTALYLGTNATSYNLTLDCGNHTIRYGRTASGTGIVGGRIYGLSIQNCTIVQDSSLPNSTAVSLTVTASLTNNTILTYGDNSHGIYAYSSYGGNFSGNTITTAGSRSYGMYLDMEMRDTITRNRVTAGAPDSYAIYFGSQSLANNIFDNIFSALTPATSPFNGYYYNAWNTSRTAGVNIIGGDVIGGNFYTNAAGTGYSDTCTDADADGICDAPLVISQPNAIDYLPLAVPDIVSPIITVPTDIIATAVLPEGIAVDYSASATDNVGVTSFACSPSSGSVFPIGDTVVICTAGDAAGNSASASFSVTVNPPAGYTEAGDNIAVALDAGVSLTFSNIASSGITTVSVSSAGPALPTQFKLGNPPIYYDISTTALYNPPIEVCFSYAGVNYQNENTLKLRHFNGVNWVDITKVGYPDTVNKIICGITDTLSPFAITELADEIPPTITVPGPIVAEANSLSGATVSYDAFATDNVGVISFSCSPASGSIFPLGVTSVNCDASDAVGNTATASFTVTVDLTIKMDIKPGSYPNSINPKNNGKIPVAILSTSGFNALTQTNKTSLTFGRTGNEKSLSFCNANGEDVNKDGLLDLVCHFQTQQANFQIGNTEGNLKGKTVGGVPLAGKDSVRLVPAN